jgi:ankyrin repeat protein
MAKKKRGKKAQEKLNNGLFDASERGDVGEARKLLDQGADANARNQSQYTPLHIAMNDAMVKLLLDLGADVNSRDRYQRTPLNLAMNVAKARLLVNRGAQLTAVDEDGRNALHRAAHCARLDLCLFLVSRGLDPNIADNEGETALTLYGRNDELDEDDEEKQEAVVQLLAAREAYEQRVREEHWKKNWPLLNTLTSSGGGAGGAAGCL